MAADVPECRTWPGGRARLLGLAGIIGDRPSLYAKSPSLWNAVFKTLGLDATYLAFDVDEPKLKGLCDAPGPTGETGLKGRSGRLRS